MRSEREDNIAGTSGRYQGMKLLCIYLGSTAKTVAVRAVSKFIEVNLGKTRGVSSTKNSSSKRSRVVDVE